MEFSSSIPMTFDNLGPITESNIEEFQRRNYMCCPKCLINFIDLIILIITFIIFTALSIIEIFVGINYINDCSMNRYIPIYLIVAGFISFIIFIFAVFGVNISFITLLHRCFFYLFR